MVSGARLRTGLRDLAGLVVGGVVAGTAHALVFRSVERSEPFTCSDGLEGLGCALTNIALAAVAALVAGGLLNWACLRFAHTPHAGPVALVATVAFVAWWGIVDSIIPGTNWALVPLLAPPVTLNVLTAGLFRAIEPRRLAVAGVLVALVAATFPLADAFNGLEIERNRQRRNEQIAGANFVTYTFGWLPSGYEARDVLYHEFGDDPFSDVDALHGNNDSAEGDPSPFELTSFRVRPSYDPPANCGMAKPYNDERWPCREAGRTARGEVIYVDNGATFSNRQTFYVARGRTLITLDTSSYEDEMPLSTVIRLFDGLRVYRP